MKKHFRRGALCQTEEIFEKRVQTVAGMIHAQLTRTEESGIWWKISCADVDESFRRSQNWFCNSSRILAI